MCTVGLTLIDRRISQGHSNLMGTKPVTLLRDIDQPFIFEISFGRRQYRLELYDTSSPENWRLLQPDLVLICYDISQRLSLMNLQRLVRLPFYARTYTATSRLLTDPLFKSGSRRSARLSPLRARSPWLFWDSSAISDQKTIQTGRYTHRRAIAWPRR